MVELGDRSGQQPTATPEYWFTLTEFQDRLDRVHELMRKREVDLLVLFEPESITYVTGFFTMGYSTSYQLAVIPIDAEPVVLLRDVEEFYFDRTSPYRHHLTWSDGQDPVAAAIECILEIGGAKARIGIEEYAWPLRASGYRRLRESLAAALFVDMGMEVATLRFCKSNEELKLMRQAAKIAELGMATAAATAREGISEFELAAEVSGAMIRNGAEHGTDISLASGTLANYIHGIPTDKALASGDLVFVELAPCVRQYHARFMRPIMIGRPAPQEIELAESLIGIQDQALSEVAPGVSVSIPDRIYREGIVATGATDRYTNKTFYSIGLMLYPNTFEPLEVNASATWSFEVGMTFHTYLVVKGLCFSESIVVTSSGYDRLTQYPRELITT